jgi:ubiquinone/menaquinone biosynthesis C-methylase UbiE
MEIKEVYNNISNDFSKTRYSVWSGVKEFLDNIPSNSNVADIGCGNGKNMLYRNDLQFKGIDISSEFIKICKKRLLNVIEGSILEIPFNDNYFDYTISIAVIHHLKTEEERIKAITELIRITKPDGKILIYVWAFEQPLNSKRQFVSSDVLVPFVTKNGIYNRFYHVYKKYELENEVSKIDSNCKIINCFYELGNWVMIIQK